MADTRPKYTTVARAKNYWMSTQALSIMRNALGEPNRIQASAASGARFFCHFEDIGDADAESVFGFDVGHNFCSWPLSISPTYFSTNKAVYPHISIPRDDNGNAQAMVVFPTEVLDLWGYATYTEPMKNEDGNYIDEYGNVVTRAADAATAYIRKKKSGSTTIDDDPIGSDDYYYIFLQGMITSSGDAGTTARQWNPMYATGLLNTAESWGEVITIEDLAKEMKKKVDVEWFQRIFTIHGTERKRVINSYDADGNPVYAKDANGNYIYSGTSTKRDVKPNDMDHEITDTESMFGTWTEQFLSALGKGSGSGGSGTALEQPLLTINTSNMGLPSAQQDGYTFVWDHTLNGGNGGFKWGKAGGSEDDILKSPLTEINKAGLASAPANGSLLLYMNGAWGYSTIPYRLEISDSNHSLTVDTTITWATGTFSLDIKPLLDNYLSQDDADTRYVRKAWFDKVFKTYVGNTPVPVNDAGVIAGTTTLDNLKILVGTWTEQYVSALGQGSGGGGGGGTALNYPLMSINDINANPTSGQVGYTLVWNGSSWGYGTSGIDQTALSEYLTSNNYIKADTATKWWGKAMTNGIVTGPMTGVTSIDGVMHFEFIGSSYRVGIGTNDPEAKLHVVGNSKLWGNITMNGSITGLNSIDGLMYFDSARVGIGVSSPDTKLHVSGNVTANNFIAGTANGSYIQIGPIKIEYEASTTSLKVYNTTANTVANLYTTGGVSALGAGSGGGAATGMDWEALEYYDNQHQIDIRYLDLSSYALKSEIPSEFNLQKASATVLGGVKVGDTLEIDGTGVLNQKSGVATAGTYFKATVDTYGRVTGGSDSLAASDIPTLTVAKISDLSLDANTGEITIGSNTITPLTDAKLKSDYEWWGAKLDATTKKREGDMSNVGDISFQASGKNIGGVAYFDTTANAKKLGINQSSPAYTLDVTGNVRATQTSWFPAIELSGELSQDNIKHPYIDFHYNGIASDYTTRIVGGASGVLTVQSGSGATGLVVGISTHNDYIKIGGATIYWDANNQALHIDKGVYSDTFVSALGSGSGGGSGGGIDMNDVWSALGAGTNEKIANSHLSFNINNYVTTDELNTAIGNCVAPSDIGTLTINNQTWNPYTDGDKSITISSGGGLSWSDLLTGANHQIGSYNSYLDYVWADKVMIGTGGWNTNYNFYVNGISYFYGDIDCASINSGGQLFAYGIESAGYMKANCGIKAKNVCIECYSNGDERTWKEDIEDYVYYNDEINNFSGTLYLQYSNSNGLSLCCGGGNVGVGAPANNNYKLYVSGDAKIQGDFLVKDFKINSYIPSGTSQVCYQIGYQYTSIYTLGSWSSGSDLRRKDILAYSECSLEDVARAPIFDFAWKGDKSVTPHLGTSAQYWKNVFSNAVSVGPDDYLAMDYGATALAAAVMTARKVLTHEEQIAALTGRLDAVEQENKAIKAENAWLRQEVELLKAA